MDILNVYKNIIKRIGVLLLVFLSILLVACKEHNNKFDGFLSFGWAVDSIPKKGVVYVCKKNTNFMEVVDSISVVNIEVIDSSTMNVFFFVGSYKLPYDKDYRLLIDDSIEFCISNILREERVDSCHWTMGGPFKHHIISSMKVNNNIYHNPIFVKFPQSIGRHIRSHRK